MLHKTITRIKILLSATAAIALLMLWTTIPAFATDYNCGAYGAGTYNSNSCGGGTGLENTGQRIWPIIVAVVLILAGTLLLFRTRKKMKDRRLATQEATPDPEDPQQPPQPPEPPQPPQPID